MYNEFDIDMALTEYMDSIVASYKAKMEFREWVSEFDVTTSRGSKFIKVIKVIDKQRSVHSFVCIKAHDKWKVGDVLMAASWSAPAKNFSRGNILTQVYKNPVFWTGAY